MACLSASAAARTGTDTAAESDPSGIAGNATPSAPSLPVHDAITRTRSGYGLGAGQESVEHPGPEAEPVHRHPFVDPVEHPGEIQVGRKLQRGETEAPHAEPAEVLPVGAAGQAVRNRPGGGILRLQRG